VAGNYPQAAYAGFTFCLQNDWQYVQCMKSDKAPHFASLEVAIRTKFLLALMGIAASDLDGEFRELLTHGVKTGGIAIRNPVAPSFMSTRCPCVPRATSSPQWLTRMLT
jgi:hypothetical protein